MKQAYDLYTVHTAIPAEKKSINHTAIISINIQQIIGPKVTYNKEAWKEQSAREQVGDDTVT